MCIGCVHVRSSPRSAGAVVVVGVVVGVIVVVGVVVVIAVVLVLVVAVRVVAVVVPVVVVVVVTSQTGQLNVADAERSKERNKGTKSAMLTRVSSRRVCAGAEVRLHSGRGGSKDKRC